jgi:hypothetical protein
MTRSKFIRSVLEWKLPSHFLTTFFISFLENFEPSVWLHIRTSPSFELTWDSVRLQDSFCLYIFIMVLKCRYTYSWMYRKADKFEILVRGNPYSSILLYSSFWTLLFLTKHEWWIPYWLYINNKSKSLCTKKSDLLHNFVSLKMIFYAFFSKGC